MLALLIARVIDNWRWIDRGKRMLLKRKKRGKGRLLRLGEEKKERQEVGEVPVVGWAGGVARRLVAGRYVHKAGAS